MYRFIDINLDFINIKAKIYCLCTENKIDNNNHELCTKYRLYEYCIILHKYKYIKQYCHHKLKSSHIYSFTKFFQYCKEDDI